jgi:hypothetical protein
MTPVVFASPDFGAGGCAGCLMLLIAAAMVAFVVLGIWVFLRLVKSPKRRTIIGLSVLAAFIPVCYFTDLYEFKPYRDFRDILLNNSGVHIDRIEIDGQGRHVTLDEPATISYLNERVRLAAINESERGITYSATVYLSSGNSVYCIIDVPTEKSVLTIYFPGENLVGEGSNYLVSLPDPVPPGLSHVLVELGK